MILNMKSYPPFAFWTRRSPVMPQSTKKNPLERRGLCIYMPKKRKKVDSSQSDAYHCIDANLNIVTQSLTWEWENVEVQFRVLLFLLLTFSAPPATKFIQVDSLSRGEKLAHLMDDHLSLSFYDKTTSLCSFPPNFIFLTLSANIFFVNFKDLSPTSLLGGQTQFSGRAKLCWISIELLIAAYQQIRLLPARRNLNTGGTSSFWKFSFCLVKYVFCVCNGSIGRCSLQFMGLTERSSIDAMGLATFPLACKQHTN